MRNEVIESVSRNHPDKVADRIVGIVLAEILQADNEAVVGIDATITGVLRDFPHPHIEVILIGTVVSRLVNVRRVMSKAYSLARSRLASVYGSDSFIHFTNMIRFELAEDVKSLDTERLMALKSKAVVRSFFDPNTKTGFSPLQEFSYAFQRKLDNMLPPKSWSKVTTFYDNSFPIGTTIIKSCVEVRQPESASVEQTRLCILNTMAFLLGRSPEYRSAPFFSPEIDIQSYSTKDITGVTGRKQSSDQFCGMVPSTGGSLHGKSLSNGDLVGHMVLREFLKIRRPEDVERSKWCQGKIIPCEGVIAFVDGAVTVAKKLQAFPLEEDCYAYNLKVADFMKRYVESGLVGSWRSILATPDHPYSSYGLIALRP